MTLQEEADFNLSNILAKDRTQEINVYLQEL